QARPATAGTADRHRPPPAGRTLPGVPVEPPPTRWALPDPAAVAPGEDLAGVGADLEPGTLLAAYRSGLFPMPVGRRVLGWWSPDPRGVLPLDGLRVTRSLRRSVQRFRVEIDTAFGDVVAGCADPRRPGGWIDRDVAAAYGRLHRLGWAHSVEAYAPDGRLAGGLYGVAVGGLFAGESMFRVAEPWARDASKVALVRLVEMLRDAGPDGRLLDVQWRTDHLASLGAVAVPRPEYLRRLRAALPLPVPAPFRTAVAREPVRQDGGRA
ncbi:MAG TPA: leucyl/phenylalanyl-tRNA--protein transferase, partial [Jiangellales bacterium]|nr:leucyl/phenylalanyl-tRNA--protein transferase [Jiangellales bacterium]